LFFKNDGITYTLHAIFNEVLIAISILVHVKVLYCNFSTHKAYVEKSSKSFRLFQIEYGFFQMIVTWESSDDDLGILGVFIGVLEIDHSFDK